MFPAALFEGEVRPKFGKAGETETAQRVALSSSRDRASLNRGNAAACH
jgi:hypothetical protein